MTSLDDETKRILAEADADDSKESKIPKEKPKESHKNSGVDGEIQYEINTEEDLDSEW